MEVLFATGDVLFLVHKYSPVVVERQPAQNHIHVEPLVVPVFMTTLYVTLLVTGRNWMMSRQSFELKETMWSYNLFQMIFNLYTGVSLLWHVYHNNLPFWGMKLDVEDDWLAFLIYLHYHNKYVEYFDEEGTI